MDARLYDPVPDNKIVRWRLDSFERLGFGVLEASALSVRRDIDREDVERMLKGGASHAQVMSIVA